MSHSRVLGAHIMHSIMRWRWSTISVKICNEQIKYIRSHRIKCIFTSWMKKKTKWIEMLIKRLPRNNMVQVLVYWIFINTYTHAQCTHIACMPCTLSHTQTSTNIQLATQCVRFRTNPPTNKRFIATTKHCTVHPAHSTHRRLRGGREK